jgi:pimeloyl-ACP methyl ester carboxylesterase
MKLKSLFLFFALMMGSATIANAQVERIVHWIHGLGGDGSSWQKAADASMFGVPGTFTRAKIYSNQPEYTQFNNAISTAASKLHQDVLVQGDVLSTAYGVTDQSKNFIIGHSQGGIVARYLDKRYDDQPWLGRRFGGIVTFGTSHQGAIALNNTPMLLQLIDEGCNDLSAGPSDEKVLTKFFLSLIISSEDVAKVIEPACKFIANDIVPIIASDFVSPINQDYRVGAAVITEINSIQTQTNKVAFYGIENDPLVWRMLYSLRGKQPNLFPAFGADDDSPLVAKANENQLKYEMKARFHQDRYDAMGSDYCAWWQWLYNPVFCIVNDALTNKYRKNERELKNSWTRGSNWWLNANNRYKAAMGAAEIVGTFSTAYECDCASYDGNGNAGNSWNGVSSTPQECYNQGSYDPGSGAYTNCYLGSPTTIVTYTNVNNDSDGIVLASSAMGYPGAETKEMIGSNHQQMRNDSNTKARLNELYNGTHGIYFKSR